MTYVGCLHVNPIDLVCLAGFMICFGLVFIRLSQSHDPGMVFNGLTQVDLAYFLNHFLIKFFYKLHHSTLSPT
jgi:hypothetical protein